MTMMTNDADQMSFSPHAAATMDEFSEMEATLAAANALENPLEGLEGLLSTKIKNKEEERNLHIRYQSSPLDTATLQSCLDLFEHNMGEMYRCSDWGLDMKEKSMEFLHEQARFLLVTEEHNDKVLAAFCHFRFDWNDDDNPTEAVLYVYEIQVSDTVKRFGLGKRLMNILELVARQAQMNKVLLTVFKSNKAAWNFYTRKLKFTVDDISPSCYGEEVDYEILSKRVR